IGFVLVRLLALHCPVAYRTRSLFFCTYAFYACPVPSRHFPPLPIPPPLPRPTPSPYTTLFRSPPGDPGDDSTRFANAVRDGQRRSEEHTSELHGSISYAVFCLKKKRFSVADIKVAEIVRYEEATREMLEASTKVNAWLEACHTT